MWTGIVAACLAPPERRLDREAMERETGFEPATFSLEG